MENLMSVVSEIKAYDLLLAQPGHLRGLDDSQRSAVIISAVRGEDGQDHTVSSFGDPLWNLSPWFSQANRAANAKTISWPSDLPKELIDDCKAVLYAWFKRGIIGSKPPEAGGLCGVAINSAIPFMRWLQSVGVLRMDQVKSVHISNYLQKVKVGDGREPSGVYNVLRIIDLLWKFREEMIFPLPASPWKEKSLWEISGISKPAADDGVGKTPIIPADDQAKIFNYCEKILANAQEVFDARELGEIDPSNTRLIQIRDCGLYILSITSGMRNEEAIGVENDSWRTEIKNGVEYHWVATTERKTGKGRVEYLIPRLTIDALNILKKYAQPLQARLSEEISALVNNSEGQEKIKISLRLKTARSDAKKLFLGVARETVSPIDKSTVKTSVQCLKSGNSWAAFERLAGLAGSSWKLAPHQCRRTYARNFVESRMGRASLVFLKWQFKHSSMSMTQLYASNPMQDAAIFDDILQEMLEFKVDIIESWLGERPLSGGAGKEIQKMRAIPIANRQALLAQTASQVHIRATGHGWCLAQERGCGGAGLYESTRCVGCKSSVIDPSFTEVWRGIHDQQQELLEIKDAGPAVLQRAERDEKWARQVMIDLGAKISESNGGKL